MRIALLAPLIAPIREPQLGGVATLLTDLAAGLADAGHEVDLFAASGSRFDGLRLVDTGVRAADVAGTLHRPLGPPPGQRELRRARAAFTTAFDRIGDGYDLVHNHAFDPPAIELASGLPCPVVHTLHLPPHPFLADALCDAQGGSRPPCLAAVSRTHRAAWERFVPVDTVLRPGVPVARIPWGGSAPDGPLVCAGRISPEKGTLDAIAIARRAGRPLVVAGHRYDDPYARAVEQAAGPDVVLAGSLPRTALWSLLARAAALLFPIGWDEPFGMVTAEAQAAGCPVIGYRRGALPDVIADGTTGIVVDPGDVDAAAAGVATAGALDRTACRRHAERTLALAPMIRAHVDLYARLVGSPTPAAR